MEKYYFETIDSTICYPLNKFIKDAKEYNLETIKLIEAEPSDEECFIFCSLHGEVSERSECNKSLCDGYKSKSGRGVCSNRGKLFDFGKEVVFSVATGGFLA